MTIAAGVRGQPALPDRPVICTPPRLLSRETLAAERERMARQPGLGIAGLVLVVPVALFLTVGLWDRESSFVVLAPLSTFALPVVAVIAFWWEDWPGSRLRPGWSGLLDTAIVVAGAVVLTIAAQAVVGSVDLRGVFDATPGPGHSPTFPATMPIAAVFFVAILQLTLVCEGWPLRRLGRLGGGLAALAVSGALALAAYLLLVEFDAASGSGLSDRAGPLTGAELGALLVCVGVWQVAFYVALRGWPFAELEPRAPRLLTANAVVLGGGVATYLLLHGVAGLEPGTISAVCGSAIAAGLVAGLLFEGWAEAHLGDAAARVATLVGVAALAAALYGLLTAYADSIDWTLAEPEDWVAYVGLNAIGLGVILHVAVGRRWPFAAETVASEDSVRR